MNSRCNMVLLLELTNKWSSKMKTSTNPAAAAAVLKGVVLNHLPFHLLWPLVAGEELVGHVALGCKKLRTEGGSSFRVERCW